MKFKKPDIVGLKSDSDIITGKYEGGFKIWESTYDLIGFINDNKAIIDSLIAQEDKIRVLELGAGAALASIALCKRLMHSTGCDKHRIHIQDYNWQVLSSLSLINLGLNTSIDFVRRAINKKTIRLFSGDWKSFSYKHKYHLIMMSEVLYNRSFYESLHSILDTQLKEDGYIVIATKNTYFGLSGSLYDWLEFVKKMDSFRVQEVIKVNQINIPRSILVLRRSHIS